jgi:hypothetical protein
LSTPAKEYMRDIARLIGAAVVVVVCYSIFVRLASPRVYITNIPAGERNEIIAERYVYGLIQPDAVIVGSSMSRRLGYGDDARLSRSFYNLALDGAGPLTGMALIAARSEKPRVVLVETNWLQRPLDREFLDNVAGFPQRLVRTAFAGLRQEFKPATLLRSVLSGRLNFPQPDDPATPPPSGIDADPDTLPTSLRYTIAHYGGAPSEKRQNIDADAVILRKQVSNLEALGVRVVLVDLPMHRDLKAAPAFHATKAALERELPRDRFRWLPLPDDDSFHTVDSIHLTGLSALRLTLLLRDAVSPL